MTVTIEVNCDHCGSPTALAATHVRRARKQGAKLYCGRRCMGDARIDPNCPRRRPRVRKCFPRAFTIAQRLEANSIPEPNSGCYLWLGPITGSGYGHFRLNGQDIIAHRVAYEQTYGPVPKGLFVCHRCDNRACVNPGHLFAGTHEDNMADMAAKKRNAFGERHGMAELTVPLVRAIFVAAGKQRDIAARFSTSQTTVWFIKTGGHWADATADLRAQAAIDAIAANRRAA